MLQSHLQQPAQPSRDEVFRAAERQSIVQDARTNHPRHHVHAGAAQMRHGNFQRVAVHEQPRRIGKTLTQPRQFTDVPGIELDHQSPLHTSTRLPIGRQQPLERRAAFDGRQITAQQPIQRRRFGDDDMVVQLRQHLADQCRTTARGMKDERTGHKSRALLLPLGERVQGCLAPERLVEGQAQGVFHGITEEGLRQGLIAEPAPIDPPLSRLLPHANRQPVLQVQAFHWSLHCRRPLRMAARNSSRRTCSPCRAANARAHSMKASGSARLCRVLASCGSLATCS